MAKGLPAPGQTNHVLAERMITLGGIIEAALPKHLTAEKFTAAALSYLSGNAQVQAVAMSNPDSLCRAIIKAASMGLLPDGVDGWLVVTRNHNVEQVDFWESYIGIAKLLYQSGKVKSINANVVRDGDGFDHNLGTNRFVSHKLMGGHRGDVTFAWCEIVTHTGGNILEVITIDEINKRRRASRGSEKPGSPWINWFDEMAKKTAVRMAAKTAPSSNEIIGLLNADDDFVDVETDSAAESESASASTAKAAPRPVFISAPPASVAQPVKVREEAQPMEVESEPEEEAAQPSQAVAPEPTQDVPDPKQVEKVFKAFWPKAKLDGYSEEHFRALIEACNCNTVDLIKAMRQHDTEPVHARPRDT